MTENRFPPGWDEQRVKKALDHYESQSEEEALAEDEASYDGETSAVMAVPVELVPVFRELIAKHEASQPR